MRVTGTDARHFLNGLVTCDMDRISPDAPRFGALLTPQGKILFDFLIFEALPTDGGGFVLDVLRFAAPDLVKRLSLYKLRAKVEIADISDACAIVAGWGDTARPGEDAGLAAADPRLAELGWRAIVAADQAPSFDVVPAEDYHVHRIVLGVPEAGKDFLLQDAFPHEALMDQLHGVDFGKGCYVGQEVVSRMQHRGTARTRIVPARYRDGFVAEPGFAVTDGDKTIGKTGGGLRGLGLLMLRLDKADAALQADRPIMAGGLPVTLVKPNWIVFPFPGDPSDTNR